MELMKPRFPEGFYFGAATSAHQVEGGNHNDWSEWEKKNAKRLARQAKEHPPTAARLPDGRGWPEYILKNYPNPFQEENYISGRACDHYHRYEEDFDLAKQLGHNAHRFSIEWSRIEPEEGKWNEKEIEHYRKVILALRKRKIEPFVTLWHWTIPLWLRDRGGWMNKESPKFFARYTKQMARALSDVRFWITLNEPNVYASHGYWKGNWPPGEHSLFKCLAVNKRLSQAHIAAYQAVKTVNPDAQIGIAQNFIWFTKGLSALKRFAWNHFFLRLIRHHQDFIGLNYYHSDRDIEARSEFSNWPIDAEGIYAVIKELSLYHRPLYMTENGIADARDLKRAQFIGDHLSWIQKAIREGADIRGYFHWSLTDNFEWDKGFWPRFGLVEVDYRTLAREIRPSAYVYKSIIEQGIKP